MAIRVVCSNCDRTLTFPDSEAGLPALCNACGTRFTVPTAAPLEAEASVKEAAPSPVPTGEPAPVEAASGGSAWLVSACVGGGILLVVLIGAFWFWKHNTPVVDPAVAWERDNAARVESLKAQAEALAAAGKPREALNKYLELGTLLGDHVITDAALKADIEKVRVEMLPLVKAELARADSPSPGDGPASPKPPTIPKPISVPAHPLEVASKPTPAVPVPAPTPSIRIPAPPAPPIRGKPAIPVLRVARASSPLSTPRGEVTDEEIGAAIQKGVDYLIGCFGREYRIDGATGRRSGYTAGMDALAVYALAQCADAIHDDRLVNPHGPFFNGAIKVLKTLDMGGVQTYGRGIRASALSLLGRKEDAEALKDDVRFLLASHWQGAYSYDRSTGSWDNSNSQYGLLGVWAGAEANVEVPQNYWQKVEKHWTTCQLTDGQWGYAGFQDSPRLSMTLAGVASLFVTHDYLDAPRFNGAVGRDPFSPSLAKGLAWLEDGNHIMGEGGYWGYTLYGVERVGLASGFKFFGTHDWYREMARIAVDKQNPDGSWGEMPDTCYALLFLARGRHPVMMNKLRFDGFWANRPRDVANLARFATHELERPLNWQVVSLARDWTDWNDSPILYVASHEPPQFTDADLAKIRSFVMAGGLLFTQADGDSPAFNTFAGELAHKLFPDYEMKPLAADSAPYTLVYKLNPGPGGLPPLKGVSNGSRWLMIHSPTDIAMAWQLRAEKTKEPIFQLGVNLFLYASGKTDLRNRLNSAYILPQQFDSGGTVHVARVKYPGSWDPEPEAWPRFVRWMGHETSLTLDVQPVDMQDLAASNIPVAHLTGTTKYSPTDAEAKALRQYVEAGGTLVIDCCGGSAEFNDSVIRNIIPKAFPDARPRSLGPMHPLLSKSFPGMTDLSGRPPLRPYTISQLGSNAGSFEIFTAGKGRVIYTSLDLVSGLLGTHTWGIAGYEPRYCEAFFQNVILWVANGAKEKIE